MPLWPRSTELYVNCRSRLKYPRDIDDIANITNINQLVTTLRACRHGRVVQNFSLGDGYLIYWFPYPPIKVDGKINVIPPLYFVLYRQTVCRYTKPIINLPWMMIELINYENIDTTVIQHYNSNSIQYC